MRRLALLATILITLSLSALPATAQNDPQQTANGADALTIVLGFMTSTSSTLSGVATGYSMWGMSSGGVTAQLERYISAHQADLEQDLALGQGPTIRDLAEFAQVEPEHRSSFGKFLRKNRADLLDLANADTLTPARTQRFADRITALSLLAADAS